MTAGRKGAEVMYCVESGVSQAGRMKSRVRIVSEIAIAVFCRLGIGQPFIVILYVFALIYD